MDCLFCGIACGDKDAKIFFDTDSSLAFLDVFPRVAGHTLVIPKKHAETVFDLSDEEIGILFRDVREVTKKLNSTLSPDGFTIGINHGKAGGQAVEHLHIHIMPRFHDDGGGSLHSVVNDGSRRSIDDVFSLLVAKK